MIDRPMFHAQGNCLGKKRPEPFVERNAFEDFLVQKGLVPVAPLSTSANLFEVLRSYPCEQFGVRPWRSVGTLATLLPPTTSRSFFQPSPLFGDPLDTQHKRIQQILSAATDTPPTSFSLSQTASRAVFAQAGLTVPSAPAVEGAFSNAKAESYIVTLEGKH